ncbi:MAG: hypothetical protein LUI13_09965 [Lachnospiraceae bacterium]|nr:hypothetical protein [Lachnospiraceae bacterium]
MAEISFGLIYADILTSRQALTTYKENPRIKDIKNIAASLRIIRKTVFQD